MIAECLPDPWEQAVARKAPPAPVKVVDEPLSQPPLPYQPYNYLGAPYPKKVQA